MFKFFTITIAGSNIKIWKFWRFFPHAAICWCYKEVMAARECMVLSWVGVHIPCPCLWPDNYALHQTFLPNTHTQSCTCTCTHTRWLKHTFWSVTATANFIPNITSLIIIQHPVFLICFSTEPTFTMWTKYWFTQLTTWFSFAHTV